ncbi:hypothetical protein BD410DRAFT_760259 [Rickenella mellea]|uniref:TM7S3/TM198-like domain-containing protein n=1 Tax=Rickenella mellea TaxID=50990 RepID=A0A4Y7QN84_9AGAM|nr:hypothetical protein BD410DRAFT_760259 [Rickenella mellea]
MGYGLRSSLLFFSIFAFSLSTFVQAQSTSSTPPDLTTSLTTSSVTTTQFSRSAGNNVPVPTVIATTFNVTVTLSHSSSTPSPTQSANGSASATPTPKPISLDTRLDPAFGVLGAILILTGLPSAFWGHKNRWSSFFLIGFYTLALTCLALILKFGVLSAVNPPNQTLRGLFVLACGVAGVAGGGVAIFFWQQAKYFIGAWGGFAIGLWVQCLRNGGLIRPIGLRWIMYIGLGVVGFVICTIPKLHYHVLLAATAVVGASAFILGVDCFTTAGLKEFYIWNLGFDSLFPKFYNAGIHFPVSQMMEIELGLIGAVALMGAAVQWRILKILQFKLNEIKREQKRRDEELEAQATARFAGTAKDMEEWEKEHGRKDSQYSSMPLMRDQEVRSPSVEDASQFTLTPGIPERRARYQSGVSDFVAASPAEDEWGRPKDPRQSIGALPALDLGNGIQRDLPQDFVRDIKDNSRKTNLSADELEALKEKERLLAEIQNIRKSIDVLSSETPESRSRHQSFTSRRTLSQDLATAMDGLTHLRPPRQQEPRIRRQSAEVLSNPNAAEVGASIGRPTSVPLKGEDWDAYVSDRKLFQPPAGVSAPILPSAVPTRASQYMPVPDAVSEALERRQQRESALGLGDFGLGDGSANTRSSLTPDPDEKTATRTTRRHSVGPSGSRVPITILPPKKVVAPIPQRPEPARTRTFEELNERHREKMRHLQEPLSKAEQEQAQLSAAKNRWERSKAVEKQVMARKEAEVVAKRKSEEGRNSTERRRSKSGGESHRRTLSADQLAKIPAIASSSKRQSLLKVEDWQRHQTEADVPLNERHAERKDSGVPFPSPTRAREPGRTTSRANRNLPGV